MPRPASISLDQHVDAPTGAVWQALTTPDGVASWWAPGDVAAVAGHSYLLTMPGWGEVPCTVREVEPERRFVHTFGDWTIGWTLTPVDGGTVVRLDHDGFDLDRPGDAFAHENMGRGWRDEVLPRLARSAEDR